MGIKQLSDKIAKELEALDYQEILPPKQAVMLMQGEQYVTGSDYYPDQLEMSLNDIIYDKLGNSHNPIV